MQSKSRWFGCKQGDGEITASDPHHGAKPVGAPAAHRALARAQGDRAAAILDRYMVPEEVSGEEWNAKSVPALQTPSEITPCSSLDPDLHQDKMDVRTDLTKQDNFVSCRSSSCRGGALRAARSA